MTMRFEFRKKKKPSTERRSSKTVDEYICINGKKLSEQSINDYAQFIPHWDTREEIGDSCYLVRCVNPYNHKNMDEHPSMMIGKGRKKNVILHCRLESCPDDHLLEYFKVRLIGEVHDQRRDVFVESEKTKEQKAKAFLEKWSLRKSSSTRLGRRSR